MSVIWGNVAGAGVVLAAAWVAHPFLPRSLGNRAGMSELVRFGSWISLGRALNQMAGQADRLIVGKFFAEGVLGGYHLAHRIATGLPNMVTGAIDQVFLPIYSGGRNDAAMIERGYWKGIRFSAMLVVPFVMLLVAYADGVVGLLMGAEWIGIAPLVRTLALVGMLQAMGGGVFASAIYASNLPWLNPVVAGFRLAGLPLAVWIGSGWGIEGVAWSMAVFATGARLFNQWLVGAALGYRFKRYLTTLAAPVAANLLLLATAFFVALPFHGGAPGGTVTGMLVGSAAGLIVYVGVSRLLLAEETAVIMTQARRAARALSGELRAPGIRP
jgi:O-antigen/teichoic acid export membrane protein